MQGPFLSVVIPVYNEEAVLRSLFLRLMPVLHGMNRSFEVICVNDGSTDDSQAILEALHRKYPDYLRVLTLTHNSGQHPAILAGFTAMRGEVAVTMDADLQNPPEDIPKLIALIDKGHDVVGGYRCERNDPVYRRAVSKLSNLVRERTTDVQMRDHGCMLRAYLREIVQEILDASDANPFVTAMSQYLAVNPAEIEVGHERRPAGRSSYDLYGLIRYNFDLITAFSLIPLQMLTIIGFLLSAFSAALVFYLTLRWLFAGPETESVLTLFALLFFLGSVSMAGLGLLGEYVGRIHKEVCRGPGYRAREYRPKQPHKKVGN